MIIAIKQPYFLPYLGYFQTIKYVDSYVFYDDVNYYRGGFINRNKILVNNSSTYITIPLNKASKNKLINEIQVINDSKEYKDILKTLYMSYKKAPYFDNVYPILENILNSNSMYISELNHLSIIEVAKYLNFNTKFYVSSESFSESKGIGREIRLIDICKKLKADTYLSELGGKGIYITENFKSEGIDFKFIIHVLSEYKQFKSDFVPNLSIIDVLMFNSVEAVNQMIDKLIIE